MELQETGMKKPKMGFLDIKFTVHLPRGGDDRGKRTKLRTQRLNPSLLKISVI